MDSKSKWHSKGHTAFVLKEVRLLRVPVPAVGALGFWETEPQGINLVHRCLR